MLKTVVCPLFKRFLMNSIIWLYLKDYFSRESGTGLFLYHSLWVITTWIISSKQEDFVNLLFTNFMGMTAQKIHVYPNSGWTNYGDFCKHIIMHILERIIIPTKRCAKLVNRMNSHAVMCRSLDALCNLAVLGFNNCKFLSVRFGTSGWIELRG